MKNTKHCFHFTFLFLLATVILIGGCVSTPSPVEQDESVFFPDPPAPPRMQFLTSYTSSNDVGGAASAFDSFLTGEKKVFELIKPYGIAMQDGKIYVCDSQSTMAIFDLKNQQFRGMKGAKGLGKVVQPINISIDAEGNKFIADRVRGEVLMYDANDFYIKSFGVPGQWKPTDASTYDGLLYVVDAGAREIKVFDIETAKKLRAFGQNNKPEENLGLPTGITIGTGGLLYISDSGRFQVVVYDRDGHERKSIGRPGANLGHFARPRGIDIDRDGRVYAVDAAFENVQVFRNDGQLLFAFGGSGTGPGKLFLPADVSIDYDNISYFEQFASKGFEIEYLVLVSSQFGDRLINVYGFGKEKGRVYPSEEQLQKRIKEKLKKWQKEAK